ncbi:hypothetical protein KSP40_PGU013581 [Platanthera guangdongensis]|uniref:R3H domain-containing protein n=1 Tax=Platanthera guangdongensis TaxID=2320717 RepID=A0ABR2LD88_9ASPA
MKKSPSTTSQPLQPLLLNCPLLPAPISPQPPEAVLELQPMSPYQRLLLHRLAEIYGFAHESVGEGEERHLLLERCPKTAMYVSFVVFHLLHYINLAVNCFHVIKM